MRYIFICLLFVSSMHLKAQESNCYSIIIKGATICNSTYTWNTIKVTASKEKLLNFLRTNTVLHPCNFLLMSEGDILKKFEKADCSTEFIKIEFEEPKDVLQLYTELKEKKQKESSSNSKGNNSSGNKQRESRAKGNVIKENEEPASAEICISSNGEISLSFGNELGAFQATSKGKFSVSVKGENDTEYKVGL